MYSALKKLWLLLKALQEFELDSQADFFSLKHSSGLEIIISEAGLKAEIAGDCRVNAECFYFNCEEDYVATPDCYELSMEKEYAAVKEAPIPVQSLQEACGAKAVT